MSFLLGDDYASSSGASESDEEESVTRQTPQQEHKTVVELLPSADSILSSVSASRASFLPPKSSAKTESAVESFDLLQEREKQCQQQEQQQQEQQQAERIAAAARRPDRKRPPPAEDATTRQQATKRDKTDAKERVKNQRVKGQAGIGSDFRGWKSETEMALRQQFD